MKKNKEYLISLEVSNKITNFYNVLRVAYLVFS